MFSRRWRRLWLRFSGITPFGKFAAYMAGMFVGPYYARVALSRMHPNGYVSPRAMVSHPLLYRGRHVHIDDGVLIFQDKDGGAVDLGDGVHLHRDTILQTGQGGRIQLGAGTHVQPRCQLSAYKASIEIGKGVEIAPYCAFYPYDHGIAGGEPIRTQPLVSKGGIIIEDDAWLSVGVKVLDGVRIGTGAVVGAGAVVTKDLPPNSICAGVPARVVKMREAGPVETDNEKDKAAS